MLSLLFYAKIMQQVRPGGKQQQTASSKEENKLAKKLAQIFQVSLLTLTNQTSSIKTLLHRKTCYHP